MSNDVTGDAKNHVASLMKGCRVVETLAGGESEYSLAQVAEANGLNKTTAHRLLQTLLLAGWVERGPEGGYRIGIRMLRFGLAAQQQFSLRREALPYLTRLAEEFGDTGFLLVPSDDGAVCVETVEGNSPLRVNTVRVGSVLPFHVAGGPSVMSAYDPEIEARVLAAPRERFTERTAVSDDELRQKFAQIRQDGYFFAAGDLLDGVAAISAPLFGMSGRLVGTISLGGAVHRFRDERRAAITEAVVSCGRELSRQLGHRG